MGRWGGEVGSSPAHLDFTGGAVSCQSYSPGFRNEMRAFNAFTIPHLKPECLSMDWAQSQGACLRLHLTYLQTGTTVAVVANCALSRARRGPEMRVSESTLPCLHGVRGA